jgi:hypothetical protein
MIHIQTNKWASSKNLDLYPFWWGEEQKIRTKETLEREITKDLEIVITQLHLQILHLTL